MLLTKKVDKYVHTLPSPSSVTLSRSYVSHGIQVQNLLQHVGSSTLFHLRISFIVAVISQWTYCNLHFNLEWQQVADSVLVGCY